MEILFEILFELIFEGSIEASKSERLPKYIRYPLIGLIILLFVSIIGMVLFLGIMCLKKSIVGGIFIIGVAVLLAIMSVMTFKKTYLKKKK